MSDEPKPEPATGRKQTADEIVAQAHGRDEQVERARAASFKQQAHDLFKRLYGRDPGPGELGVPLRGRAFYHALGMLAVLLLAGCAKTSATFGVDPESNKIMAASVDSTRFLWGTDASLTRGLDGTLSASIGSRPDSTVSDALAIARMIAEARAPVIAPVATEGEFQGRSIPDFDTMPTPPPGYRWQLQPLSSQSAVKRAMPLMLEASSPVESGGLW